MKDQNALQGIAQVVPASTATMELYGHGPIERIHAEEYHQLGNVGPHRHRDFTGGRACARRALHSLGELYPPALLKLDDRQVRWPSGYVGSITHTRGYVAAAVASHHDIQSIGIDAELEHRAKESIWKAIMTPSEIDWVNTLPTDLKLPAATLLFSARESYYKCQFTISRSWVGFHDVYVTLDHPDSWMTNQPNLHGQFTVHPIKKLPLEGTAWSGTFYWASPLILTAMTLPH